MSKHAEKIKHWASNLTAEQMRPLIVELTEFAIDSEYVKFSGIAPYWESTGDPLVDGQKIFDEDD